MKHFFLFWLFLTGILVVFYHFFPSIFHADYQWVVGFLCVFHGISVFLFEKIFSKSDAQKINFIIVTTLFRFGLSLVLLAFLFRQKGDNYRLTANFFGFYFIVLAFEIWYFYRKLCKN